MTSSSLIAKYASEKADHNNTENHFYITHNAVTL